MKTIINKIVLIGLLVLLARLGNSQGFVNPNFENANLTTYPPGSTVPAANAFPGRIVNAQYILYDNFSLSGESISIMDTNSPLFTTSIQGTYYALFIPGNFPSSSQTISLGQSGTIPPGTQSMTFWGNIGGLQITFAGQTLPLSQASSTANYNIYAANVSAFAGQTGQLLFSLPPYVGNASVDNIQLSNSPIPEPVAIALYALGGLFLAWRSRRNRSIA